jgi:hypothetical protein
MQACIFCLEDLYDQPLNFSKERICSCKIYSHIDCWMQYYLHKGYFECPICHFKIQENIVSNVPANVPSNSPSNSPSNVQNIIVSINMPHEPVRTSINNRTIKLFGIFILTGVIIFCVYIARV